MRSFLDCIPCLIRQSLEAVRFATDDEAVHRQVLSETLRMVGKQMDLAISAPVMAQQVHRMIRTLAGGNDPYRQVKDHFNNLAMRWYPKLKLQVQNADDPFETAARLAIVGNIIDFGPNSRLDDSSLHDAIDHALTAEIVGSFDTFREAVGSAENILYLADNAGEIVFDRLLIEQMPVEKITVVVKGQPVINDATMSDAESTGLGDLVDVIDNGSDAPGTIVADCSRAFRERFQQADLIIAKGQGNYETLSDVDRKIFFVLKAKCPVIAADLGCKCGSLVIHRTHQPDRDIKQTEQRIQTA